LKATLVFPIKNNQILLAKKMKKVGAGKWNGFGGKSELEDVSIRHTACRELFEESGLGIQTTPEKLIAKAVINFYFFDNQTNEPNWLVAIYLVQDFTGEALSTEEMQMPTWFSIESIPYHEMLPADKDFLPKLFGEKTFIGKVRFNQDMTKVIESDYSEMPLEI